MEAREVLGLVAALGLVAFWAVTVGLVFLNPAWFHRFPQLTLALLSALAIVFATYVLTVLVSDFGALLILGAGVSIWAVSIAVDREAKYEVVRRRAESVRRDE